MLKKLKVASCAILMVSAAHQAAAQVNIKTAICEVRPGCQVVQSYMQTFANEPFCEVILGNTQFIGGQCQGGMLSGVVQEVMWVDGRPAYKFFKIYVNGVNSQPNGDYFVKHESGHLVIERIGFGTTHYCGTIGAFSPSPGSESECEKTRQAYGEGAFSKQPPLKRDRFKVKTVSVIQGDITHNEVKQIAQQKNPASKVSSAATDRGDEVSSPPSKQGNQKSCYEAITAAGAKFDRTSVQNGDDSATVLRKRVNMLNAAKAERDVMRDAPICRSIEGGAHKLAGLEANVVIYQKYVDASSSASAAKQPLGSSPTPTMKDCRVNNPYIPKNTCQ